MRAFHHREGRQTSNVWDGHWKAEATGTNADGWVRKDSVTVARCSVRTKSSPKGLFQKAFLTQLSRSYLPLVFGCRA